MQLNYRLLSILEMHSKCLTHIFFYLFQKFILQKIEKKEIGQGAMKHNSLAPLIFHAAHCFKLE